MTDVIKKYAEWMTKYGIMPYSVTSKELIRSELNEMGEDEEAELDAILESLTEEELEQLLVELYGLQKYRSKF